VSYARSPLDPEEARRFIDRADFLWHQVWEIAPGVRTPGVNDVDALFHIAGLDGDMSGHSVLDIGTTNGGAAFEVEQRGASRVVAVDVFDEHRFGFGAIRDLLGSNVEFVQANIYELPDALHGETFDVVLFWGVLYHLRHPVLALDCVRSLARDQVMVETAICDHELSDDMRNKKLARFYRRDELGADPSNWFTPTASLLGDWCASSGLDVERLEAWPAGAPSRGHAACRVIPGVPEAFQLCFEGRVRARVESPSMP
jgi:tRNA (mo5U34)-methyltransferase